MINSCKTGPNRIRTTLAPPSTAHAGTALRPSRRFVVLGALSAATGFGLRPAHAQRAAHAIAMHGEPAWEPVFSYPTYANPQAPKGGHLTHGVLGTFDCLNPFIVKGLPAANMRGYIVESLLARGYDEPFTLYSLLADHATVLRRIELFTSHDGKLPALPVGDALVDATVLIAGRGPLYPTLSVAMGERVKVAGALSVEAAARHLNARDIDGIVVGDGFSSRMVEAFLTVLAQEPRFRDIPVAVIGDTPPEFADALPNIEHDVVERGGRHLPVRHRDTHFRHILIEKFLFAGEVFDTRAHIKGLSAAIFLAQQCLAHRDRIERRDECAHRQPIDRR